MRILFLTHAFNSLSQRLFVELKEAGHEISVEFDINDEVSIEAVGLFSPDLILAPFLKRAIPEAIWKEHVCLVVHPGIRGDRGPSALDWAILNGEPTWGVTVLQANEEMDAGEIWASVEFSMRKATKASLYRNEVTQAAVEAVKRAVERFQSGNYKPVPLDYSDETINGQLRPLARQDDRRIDWETDDTETVLRKIRSADGFPGVKDDIFGRELYLYDAHRENQLSGKPGKFLAHCGPAICRATADGAVWIGYMKDKLSDHPFKLPSIEVLADELSGLPELEPTEATGYRSIWYEEKMGVGYLYFSFYNGAMGTHQCRRLLEALQEAKKRDTHAIVLMGGVDYWSNGMHLNSIESAESPADESMSNINAIDDLALEIINTDSHLTISAMQGNAGAGGVFLARAADEVWARKGVILNPHYKDMGNLYGSEYWTYLLPRYAGESNAKRIVQSRLPMGVTEAKTLKLIDQLIEGGKAGFKSKVYKMTQAMVKTPAFAERMTYKNARRRVDENVKPLAEYREEELARMKRNFYGFDPSYHVARYNFVYKVPKSRTPLTIAIHRRKTTELKRVS